MEARSDGRADPAVLFVAQYYGRAVSPCLVAGVVGRSVVDDDRLEPPVLRELVEHPADLPGFIQRRDYHRDERLRCLRRDSTRRRNASGSLVSLSGLLHYLAPIAAHTDDYGGPYAIRI